MPPEPCSRATKASEPSMGGQDRRKNRILFGRHGRNDDLTAWHYEDFTLGESFRTMTRTPTEWDLMTFVSLGGFFEELWLNTRRADALELGASRLVPGPLTLILAEGLYVQSGRMHNAVAFLGLDEVRWHAPVSVGDGLCCVIEVTAMRRSKSQETVGIVTTLHRV